MECYFSFRTLNFCQKHLSTLVSTYLLDFADLVETRRILLAKLSGSCPSDSVLGYRVDLWADLFQSLFLQHLEVVIIHCISRNIVKNC